MNVLAGLQPLAWAAVLVFVPATVAGAWVVERVRWLRRPDRPVSPQRAVAAATIAACREIELADAPTERIPVVDLVQRIPAPRGRHRAPRTRPFAVIGARL